MTPRYAEIVAHYEACLRRHGDTHLGVDWPNEADLEVRDRTMLAVALPEGPRPATLLDFGCGTSRLYDRLRREGRDGLVYSGLDLSPAFVALCRRKFPETTYYELDVLADDSALPMFDYVVLNGVLTEKRSLEFDEMFAYARRLLKTVFAHVRVGMAFNAMSKHVDWERDDLFHLPFDPLAAFLRSELSPRFAFRSDYGLYEYTTYVYRERWPG